MFILNYLYANLAIVICAILIDVTVAVISVLLLFPLLLILLLLVRWRETPFKSFCRWRPPHRGYCGAAKRRFRPEVTGAVVGRVVQLSRIEQSYSQNYSRLKRASGMARQLSELNKRATSRQKTAEIAEAVDGHLRKSGRPLFTAHPSASLSSQGVASGRSVKAASRSLRRRQARQPRVCRGHEAGT